MFLRKLGKRGTAVVEYAVILAFVAAIGTSFTSENGMSGSVKGIIGKVENVLGLAAGNEASGKHPLKFGDGVTDATAPFLKTQTEITYEVLSKAIHDLNPNAQLQAVEFYGSGKLQNVFYSLDDQILKLDKPWLLDGEWDNDPNHGLFGALSYEYSQQSIDANQFRCNANFCPQSIRQDTTAKNNLIYIAYDKHGNVVERVDTSNFTVAEGASSVNTKSTQLVYSNYDKEKYGNKKYYEYKYSDSQGFYVSYSE